MGLNRLIDKVIVVTGGLSGVGKVAVEKFASEGAKVVIGDIQENEVEKVLNQIKANGSDGIYVNTDLEKVSDCKKLFEEAMKKYGKIDGLFCYAGVTTVSPLDTCEEEVFNNIMNVNFRASFFCCQEAIKCMRMNNTGSIVLTGSAHAWGGQKDRAAYACSKGALLTLMEHIAHNYATEQIRCNYLTLGWTPTEGELKLREQQGESEEQLRNRASKIIPMGRMLEKEDYMELLIYLMSDESKMMTGSILRMTGGEYI